MFPLGDQNLVCAIDVGTSGTRTAVFDALSGQMLAQTHKEYQSFFPQPTWVEQRALDWWNTVTHTCQASLRAIGNRVSDLVAVSVTNQRETVVAVDEDGNPLYNAIVWQDRRTVPQCELIRSELGTEAVYKETGLTIDPYFSAPKILWFKAENPRLFRSTYKFLLVHDFIINRLTNRFITDHSNASRTMLFAVEKFEWSNLICEALDIPQEKLPTALSPASSVGGVSRSASRVTGLPEGLPVVAGGGDQQCAALGVGVAKPGLVKATVGTGTFILAYQKQTRRDPEHRLLCSCHAIPGRWVMEGSVFTTGIIYRWFRDQFGCEEKAIAELLKEDTYHFLNKQAGLSEPGARGVLLLPHFTGAGAPYWNPNARGVILGLALGHKRHDIIRAIMEGTAFEVRRNIEVMQSLGIPVKEIRLTGGATRSSIWNQTQADINNLPILVSKVEEATALGAAILASVGAGIYKDVEIAAEAMVQVGESYTPRPEFQERYDTLYSIQSETYHVLEKAKVFDKLAECE